MALPVACGKPVNTPKNNYLRERLQWLSKDRACIGFVSPERWGLQSPDEEKRCLEEICRSMEKKEMSTTNKFAAENDLILRNHQEKSFRFKACRQYHRARSSSAKTAGQRFLCRTDRGGVKMTDAERSRRNSLCAYRTPSRPRSLRI